MKNRIRQPAAWAALGAAALLSLGCGDQNSQPATGSDAGLFGWELTVQNTGLAGVGLDCASLPLYTGSQKPAAGATIQNVRITTPLDLSNGGITLDRVCVQPTSVGQGMPVLTTTDYNVCCNVAPATVTISNSDLDGSALPVQDAAETIGFMGIADLRNNYVHDFGSGLALFNTGAALNAVVEGNYVTRLVAYGDPATDGNHSDGFTIRDFDVSENPSRTAIIRNNRFDCSSDNATGAFFIQTYGGNIQNVSLSGNLLEGEGYQLGLNEGFGNTYGNLSATNNRFSGTGYGPAYVQGGSGWTEWKDNALDAPAQPDHRGEAVLRPDPS
jgi:hypothetical protein